MTSDTLHIEVAILVSLLLHVGALGGWQQRAAPAAPEPATVEPPRTFMETDNNPVTGEKPSTAKYYSDRDRAQPGTATILGESIIGGRAAGAARRSARTEAGR